MFGPSVGRRGRGMAPNVGRNGQGLALMLMLVRQIQQLERKPPVTLGLMGTTVDERPALVSILYLTGGVLHSPHVRSSLPKEPNTRALRPILSVSKKMQIMTKILLIF